MGDLVVRYRIQRAINVALKHLEAHHAAARGRWVDPYDPTSNPVRCLCSECERFREVVQILEGNGAA